VLGSSPGLVEAYDLFHRPRSYFKLLVEVIPAAIVVGMLPVMSTSSRLADGIGNLPAFETCREKTVKIPERIVNPKRTTRK
jgi:hypothetical protein